MLRFLIIGVNLKFRRWLGVILLWISCFMLPAQSFQQLLRDLSNPETDADSLVQQFIDVGGKLPWQEGDTVMFLVRSPNDAPKIMSGFNGFLNPRYITDSTAGEMNSIEGSHWYYLKKQLNQDARIFYQIYSNGVPW